MGEKKNICIAFLGNAYYDTRVMNLYASLKNLNYKIKIVSFEWLQRKENPQLNSEIKLFNIRRRPSLLFYLSFVFHTVKEFLFCRCDYFFAEDVFTLPIAALLKKIKKFKIIYDSRELYPFLAGLKGKNKNQEFVAHIEKKNIYSTDRVLVTGEMDKEFLEDYYKIDNVLLQRNLPLKREIKRKNLHEEFKIPEGDFILIYQGVLLKGRGITLIIKALKYLDNVKFLILGEGDFKEEFELFAKENKVSEKVIFAGRVNQTELLNYTAGGDVGLAVIENLSKSYYYALPNKLFEYIAAGVPQIVSALPQMKGIVEKFGTGLVVEDLSPENIANVIKNLLASKERLAEYKDNCAKAFEELNWEKEFSKNKELIFD